jgi:hypothetical protein
MATINPVPEMARLFNLSRMDAYLLLTRVSFPDDTWTRHQVETDLRASIVRFPDDKAATEDLIERLTLLNLTHIGWFCHGVRAMLPQPEGHVEEGQHRAISLH